MYCLVSSLKDQPIIGLQTGHVIGWVETPILEQATLEVVAYRCRAPHHSGPLLLVARDIRQFANDCLIIDSEEEFTEPSDIVRLGSHLKARFSPLRKPVVADTGRRLGIVEDYSINLETSRVQRLYVRQPLLWNWFSPNLIIDRTQILDITHERITVRDSTVAESILSPDTIPEIYP